MGFLAVTFRTYGCWQGRLDELAMVTRGPDFAAC